MKTLLIFLFSAFALVLMEPTIRAYAPFDPEADATVLKKAMSGFGSNKGVIINILGTRNNNQRQQIAAKYKILYGKDLVDKFESELTGHLEQTAVASIMPIPDYFAKALHDAMEGPGTREEVLIEVLSSFNNAWVRKIRETYEQKYGRTLENDIKDETSGTFRQLLISLVQAQRDETVTVNEAQARADAQALFDAGVAEIGKDESTFNMIMTSRSYTHLRKVFEHYKLISGKPFDEAINDQFTGDFKSGLKAVVRCMSDSAMFYARQLHKAMAGIGTTDTTLIRIIVTGSEFDHLALAKRAYVEMYGKHLAADISKETSGEYKDLLLMLMGPS